ncbi:MAG TPA: hypothetical protein VF829_03680 [Candidatus Paceibacterota bacterium]
MNIIFKVTPDELLEDVQSLADEHLRPLERVLAEKAKRAELTLDVVRDTKQQSGNVFNASGNLVVEGAVFHARARGDSIELVLDKVRDDLVREVRTSNGRAKSLLRRGGKAVKSFLRFGRR